MPGAGVIAEYLDETRGGGLNDRRLLPKEPAARVEVRRLLDWFLVKFQEEVTGHLVTEKIFKRFMAAAQGGGRRTWTRSARRAPICATICSISAI